MGGRSYRSGFLEGDLSVTKGQEQDSRRDESSLWRCRRAYRLLLVNRQRAVL